MQVKIEYMGKLFEISFTSVGVKIKPSLSQVGLPRQYERHMRPIAGFPPVEIEGDLDGADLDETTRILRALLSRGAQITETSNPIII